MNHKSVILLSILAGCSVSSHYQSTTSTTETGNSTTTTAPTTWWETGTTETGTTTTETTPTSTTTTTPTTTTPTTTTTTSTTTTTPAGVSCHAYDPLDKVGWTRQYDIVYLGTTGDEFHAGIGLIGSAYQYESTMTAGAENWSGPVYNDCNVNDNGAFVTGWYISATTALGSSELLATLSSPRRYLPGVDEMGSGITWNYNYDIQLSGALSGSVPTSGTFTEVGFETIAVSAGTFDVYHLHHTFSQDWTAVDFGAGPLGDLSGSADYYYAEGIGLIYELTINADTGETIMKKELFTYSGL
jgi:hypothetical protein